MKRASRRDYAPATKTRASHRACRGKREMSTLLANKVAIVTGEEKVESAIFLVNNHTHETETN
jgi:hypothetical protein